MAKVAELDMVAFNAWVETRLMTQAESMVPEVTVRLAGTLYDARPSERLDAEVLRLRCSRSKAKDSAHWQRANDLLAATYCYRLSPSQREGRRSLVSRAKLPYFCCDDRSILLSTSVSADGA